MTSSIDPVIRAPAGFVPEHAIAFCSEGGGAIPVGADNPLPTTLHMPAAGSAPLAGHLDASATVGPFVPQLGRPIWISLSGDWSGSVQLLRSTDSGVSCLPLSYPDGSPKGVFATGVNAPVVEETVDGATYFLAVTLSAGGLSYRMEQ